MRARHTVLIATLGALAACAPTEVEPPPDAELVAVAQQVCPVLWNWQLDVGGIMNAMSFSARREPDPGVRRGLYTDAFAAARQRNAELSTTIEGLAPGPYVDRLKEDIRNGLFVAERIIVETDEEVASLYAVGSELGYGPMVSRIFLALEKVIDVAKPEMADYADAALTRAFLSVAQCQHGVKDANDGRPRYIP